MKLLGWRQPSDVRVEPFLAKNQGWISMRLWMGCLEIWGCEGCAP